MNEHASVIYGTHFPNRLFVGCLPSDATAVELGTFFGRFGKVIEAKVLMDDCGRSKKFGFVSFHAETSVQKVLEERPIYFKGKLINVGPAVKKDGTEKATSVQSDLGHVMQIKDRKSICRRSPEQAVNFTHHMSTGNVSPRSCFSTPSSTVEVSRIASHTQTPQYTIQFPVMQPIQHNQPHEMIYNTSTRLNTHLQATNPYISTTFHQASQAIPPASYIHSVYQHQSSQLQQKPLLVNSFGVCGRSELTVSEALETVLNNRVGYDFTRYDPNGTNYYNGRFNCVY